MKKILLLSLIFLCFIVTLNAGQDWEDKEFLGTTTFQKQMTVNGDIVSSGTITGTTILGDGSGLTGVIHTEIDPKVGANTLNYLSRWNGSALIASGLIEVGGNFGIGLSNPTGSKLFVQGNRIALRNTSAGGLVSYRVENPGTSGITGIQFVKETDYDYQVLGRSADFRIRDVFYSKDIVTIEKNSFANMLYINSAGNLGIGTTTPSSKLHVLGDIKAEYGVIATTGTFSDTIIATGTLYSGSDLDISGAGTRLIWYPKKAAFRAGRVSDDRWDEVNIGTDTISMGYNSKATGEYAVALGMYAYATGRKSLAFEEATASGISSIAIGDECEASGSRAITFGGSDNTASGIQSMTINGTNNDASGISATIINAENSIAEANYSTIFGKYMYLTDTSTNTFVYGFASSTQAITSPNSFLLFPYGETGKVGIGLKDPGATLHLNGTYADTASATQILYSTDTISVDSSYVNVVSTGGAVAVVGISTTTVVGGQIIEIWGTNDTDTIQIDSSATVALNSGVSYVLKKGYNISFRYIESIGKWCERSNRNDNVI